MLTFSLPLRLRNAVKPLVPAPVWAHARRWTGRLIDHLFDPFGRLSYSQEGEDLVLSRALRNKTHGYYIDVGAFHPKKFSNTYLFYKRGWRGINIDATPGSMDEFRRVRPGDINIETAISDQEREISFHEYTNPVYNGIDPAPPSVRETEGLEYLGTRRARTTTLANVLEQHLPPAQPIDFLSVDVEGHEMNVLRSNDWSRFRPVYVCVEERGSSLAGISSSEVARFLNGEGYELFAKTYQSLIFRHATAA